MIDTRLTRRDLLAASGATLLGGSFLGTLVGCGGGGSGFNPLVDSYDIRVGYSTRQMAGVTIRTRTYNGIIPGPVMVTRPGRTLRVRVINELPPNPPPADDGNGGGGGHGMTKQGPKAGEMNPNNPHRFNSTNLHFHGMDVKTHLFEPIGTSNPNAKFIEIEPGETYTYEMALPPDHPTGLNWYHPHLHGSTATQVFSGMAGGIIVLGAIDEVPEIAAARQEIMIVQSLRVNQSKDDPNMYEMEPIAGKGPAEGGFKTNEFDKTIFTLNGFDIGWKGPERSAPVQPLNSQQIEMRPGEVIRVRMLNGMDEQFMPVQVDGHQLHVIAWDGVNLQAPQAMDVAELAPGNRLEFLLKASDTPGVYALRQNAVVGEQFEDSSGMVISQIVVQGEPMQMALPTTLPTPEREYPIISSSEVSGNHEIRFATVFPYPDLLTGVGFTINEKLYEETRIDHTVARGTSEEWVLKATADEGHPFHIHVNSFQVIEVNGQAVNPPRIMDTVWVPKGGTVKVRMRFKEFSGKSVYHCHILIHEDTGMMQNFMIN